MKRKRKRAMENKNFSKLKDEMNKKDIDAIKSIIALTLEKIDEMELAKDELQERAKILKNDIKDFKDGRLDRIVERHELSNLAKSSSVIGVERDYGKNGNAKSGGSSHWYDNYLIKNSESGEECVLNNSLAKLHTCGTYKLKNNSVKYVS